MKVYPTAVTAPISIMKLIYVVPRPVANEARAAHPQLCRSDVAGHLYARLQQSKTTPVHTLLEHPMLLDNGYNLLHAIAHVLVHVVEEDLAFGKGLAGRLLVLVEQAFAAHVTEISEPHFPIKKGWWAQVVSQISLSGVVPK